MVWIAYVYFHGFDMEIFMCEPIIVYDLHKVNAFGKGPDQPFDRRIP
jgi:hypothetical protein